MFSHSQLPFPAFAKLVSAGLTDALMPLSPANFLCTEIQPWSYSFVCVESFIALYVPVSNRWETTEVSVGVVIFRPTNSYAVKKNCGRTTINTTLLAVIITAEFVLTIIARVYSGYHNTNEAQEEHANKASVIVLAAHIALLLIFDSDSEHLWSAGYLCDFDDQNSVDGGHGRSKVYRGSFKDSDQAVAVKRIEIKEDYERECRWREFDVVSGLDHMNIIKYHAMVMNNGSRTALLVMELCTGGTLKTMVRSNCRARFLIHEILDGLHYLHSQQICHLDLKSENIVLAGDGKLKICDFGEVITLQQPLFNNAHAIGRGANIGTVRYMSPEMVRADSDLTVIGQPSDIWSFGCVAVELLTGHPPQYYKQLEDGNSILLQEPLAILYCVGHGGKPHIPGNLASDAVDFLGHCFETDINRRWSAERLQCHSFFYDLWRSEW